MPNGGYSAQLAGTISLDDKVVSISPISADTGGPASASPDTVASLRNGFRLNGVVVVTTQTGVRIFKPAGAKGAGKTWNDFLCDSARVVRYEDRGYALAGLFGDGSVKTYSIPSLKEIASTRLSDTLDTRRFSDAIITPTGDIFGWIGPSELGVVNPWGSGQDTYVVSAGVNRRSSLTEIALSHWTSYTIKKQSSLHDQRFLIFNGYLVPNMSHRPIWIFSVSLPSLFLYIH